MTIENVLDNISRNVPVPDNEYMGKDGLLHCAKCKGAVQTVIQVFGKTKTVRCICACKKAEIEAFEERKRAEERERNRKICFPESNMASWTFANDDRANQKISDAMKKYADNFQEYRRSGKGLLLYGTVGTGKTYHAASIANLLIDKGYKVLMTNFTRISNHLQGTFEKNEYIDSLNNYSLLILDDLGVERKSEYMQEIVYNIIDARYRSGLPFIVTTNLTAEQLKKPDNIENARIYDRILERCLPVEVSGISRRKQHLKESISDLKMNLGL